MQFLILLTGVLVFVFYQFESHPVLFNKGAVEEVHNSEYQQEFSEIEQQHEAFHLQKKAAYIDYVANPSKETQSEILALDQKAKSIRDNAKKVVLKANPDQSSRDSDYVFLTFILNYLPQGLVGLLIAVIISAAMSSTAGEINALASTTMVDFYQRFSKKSKTELQSVNTSKWLTLVWGVIAIIFALSAQLVENLIEAVNILGSVFYGTILGVFLTAFFLKKVGAKAVLVGIVIGQLTVFLLFYNETVGYLWFNVIGCAIVMIVSYVISIMSNNPKQG